MQVMRHSLLALMASCALASCADAGAPTPTPSAAPSARIVKSTPVTFEIPIPEGLRPRLEGRLKQGNLETVRLILQGLRPQSARALKGVRLFLDKPDATLDTPTTDPHFAGAFVLGLEKEQSFAFNIAPTLQRLWGREGIGMRQTVQLTFVPEPWDYAKKLPEDFALSFDGVALEVPEN